jgi:hypothetical protein
LNPVSCCLDCAVLLNVFFNGTKDNSRRQRRTPG